MNIKKSIDSIFSKKKKQTSDYRVRKTLTDSERYAVNDRLCKVMNDISVFEQEKNVKIVSSATMIEEDYYNEDSYKSNRIDFLGVNSAKYTLPLSIFMAVPQKRIVICVTRALMIGYNK